jgi:hypothetical protein
MNKYNSYIWTVARPVIAAACCLGGHLGESRARVIGGELDDRNWECSNYFSAANFDFPTASLVEYENRSPFVAWTFKRATRVVGRPLRRLDASTVRRDGREGDFAVTRNPPNNLDIRAGLNRPVHA